MRRCYLQVRQFLYSTMVLIHACRIAGRMPLDYPVASESGSMCLEELSIHKERSFGQIPINDITPRT